MSFIDENLRIVFTKNPTWPQVLDLKVRRPDLRTFPLTCDNTKTRIPTLDVVNDVLATFIGHTAKGDVYKDVLANAVDSFSQPFFLPLARMQAYLPALDTRRGTSRGRLASRRRRAPRPSWGSPRKTWARHRARRGSRPHESHLRHRLRRIANRRDRSRRSGRRRGGRSDASGPRIVDRETAFVTAGGAKVEIDPAKRDQNSVQNDVEWTNGLTADALDRMHRLTRLARDIGWAITDLDLVVTAVGSTTLDATAVDGIAQLHAVQTRFGMSISDSCALVGLIPQTPSAPLSSIELFNVPVFVDRNGSYPKTDHFVHPAFRQTTTAVQPDPDLPQAAGGLVCRCRRARTLRPTVGEAPRARHPERVRSERRPMRTTGISFFQ